MNTAFLSLGGNLGQRLENIKAAAAQVEQLCGHIAAASGIYETEAWGSDSDKQYLNQVLKIETALTAPALLKKLNHIEQAFGRQRSAHRNADRSIDIDVLFYNDAVIDTPTLQVPHPRLHLRNFVLVPLNEIEKELVHPVLKKRIKTLLKHSADTLAVKPYKAGLPLKYICIEGNIGSGKSTLAQALAQKTGAHYLPEEFEKNHLLPLFYADAKRYAFPVEFSFLLARFQQLADYFSQSPKAVVSDYSFYKCLWFAKQNLPNKEYKLFKKHFETLSQHLPQPDLVIYLDTSTGNLQHNIKKRGRPYELGIPAAYLKAVTKQYRQGLRALLGPVKLVIPVSRYHPKLEAASIKIIENYIKDIFGWDGQKPYI